MTGREPERCDSGRLWLDDAALAWGCAIPAAVMGPAFATKVMAWPHEGYKPSFWICVLVLGALAAALGYWSRRTFSNHKGLGAVMAVSIVPGAAAGFAFLAGIPPAIADPSLLYFVWPVAVFFDMLRCAYYSFPLTLAIAVIILVDALVAERALGTPQNRLQRRRAVIAALLVTGVWLRLAKGPAGAASALMLLAAGTCLLDLFDWYRLRSAQAIADEARASLRLALVSDAVGLVALTGVLWGARLFRFA